MSIAVDTISRFLFEHDMMVYFDFFEINEVLFQLRLPCRL